MKSLKALLVEDSNDDAALLLRHLFNEGFEVQSAVVQTAADMKAALAEREWDIVLSDYTMPHFTCLDALSVLKKSSQDIPIIIISGTIGEDIGVKTILEGAHDYLMKGNLTRLAPAIERELENSAMRRAQKQAEETLRLSEASLANAQRIAHIGNFDWDIQNKQIFWSDEVYRILNLPKGSIESSPELIYKYIHPDDKIIANSVKAAALSKAAPYEMEIRVVRPGGEERIVHLIGELNFDKSGEPLRLTATIQDITERKAAENEMRLMKSAIDSIVEGITISDAQNLNNPIVYTNAAFENLTGYAFDEIKGQNCHFLQGTETNPRTVNEIREALEKVTTFRGEILNYHKNGEPFWNELKISPVFDQSGRLTNFVGVQQDISERMQAEKALHESEERFRSIVETTSEWIWAFDSQGNCSYSNPALETILGYAPEEIIGKSFLLIMHEEEREKIQKLMPTLIADKRGWTNFVLRWYHKDGSIRYLESNALPLLDSGGEVIGYRGSDRDITESRRIEEEKRLLTAQIERQHERLNNIVANVPGVVWEAWGKPDAATQQINFVSEYVETMLGYTVEEWITTPNFWLSIVHPEDKEWIAREAIEGFLTGDDYNRQFRWVAKDGHIVWVESQATVICDESGQSIGLRGINIDITERKRLEEERAKLIAELASEKARLQHIFDNSPSFIVSMRGPNFIFERVNQAYYELVGQRNLIGIPALEALPEVMTQGLPEIIGRVYSTGEPFIGKEMPIALQPSKDSALEQRYINFVYMPLREADGSISGVVSYGMDVTEQLLSRIKIQESEERYRLLFENNPLPMWVFELETLRFLSVNDAAIAHYGFTREEFLTMTIKDIRPPEDIPGFLEGVTKDIPGIRHVGVVRHRKKDGTIIYADIITKQLIFEGRKAKIGLANDVTERRKAEESIRFQAHLLNTVEQAVIATDLDGIVTYWNQFAEKLYGWTIAEAFGRNIRELTTSEMNQEQADQIMTQLSAGKSWSGEFTVRNKDGEDFPAHVSNSPVIDSDGKITGIVGVSVDITERSRAEKALQQAEDKYRTLVETSPAIIYLVEPHPPFSPIYVSPNVTRFGYTAEEWFDRPDMWVSLIHDEDRARVLRATKNAVAQGEETDMEYRVVAKDGAIVWLHDKGSFVLDEQGKKTGWQGVMVDITKNKELEDQLRQSQKLESVGLLAGGIAHDFNNMLTAINGYSDLTMRKMDENDPLRRNILEIKKAGQRSADLTNQLLAFSRQQILQPIVLDLNETIVDTIKMLGRLIGEDIQLTTTLNPNTGLVKVDQGQLSQIIMNLAVNARDAMPQGGKLTIETANVFLDPDYDRKHVGVLPGAYVMLAVSDTGSGMSRQTKEHIFEPFFTTKEIGKGTGLGLATVYGIVKQSGGSIEVYSEESVGTTFKLYLPRVANRAVELEIKDISFDLPKGTETILLVEDEEMVRNLSRTILEECGYTVFEAHNGLEALKICEQRDYKFDLLMTDVVMPEMGGRELADLLKEKLPDLQVLFTSGYTDDAVVRHGVIELGTNFIQKPFTPVLLAKKIRELLDSFEKSIH